MAKKLRLVAAQLTDVGRRRERNQDNVTHFIPEEEGVLEEKGALFVVCDGMGGHAAGEVAAELGVTHLRDAYYARRGVDTISALAQAVDTTNQAIFSHAREHPELAGMGTTCVAFAVVGGRAYFVNIGDSRAYLLRDGEMRQVTRDHSWVAEQVRVGLLSEDQARGHAHRNVITRSLGTQPTVTADLFVEQLFDGDRVLLCSDGLHGYVDEAEIARELSEHDDPTTTAHHMIDMANANGGPDNITALVVHLLEVPEPAGELTLPQTVLPAAQALEQAATQPLPAPESAPPTDEVISHRAKREQAKLPRKKRSFGTRLAIAGFRVLLVLVVLAAGAAGWYYEFGPLAWQRAAVAHLQGDINAAKLEVQRVPTQDPVTALDTLAATRARILADLQNANLDPSSRQQGQALLDTQLVPAVQSALRRYNQAALVTPVASSQTQTYAVTCAAPGAAPNTLSDAGALSAVAVRSSGPNSAQMLYALSGGQLYQLLVPLAGGGQVACAPVALPGITAVVAIANDGPMLYALAEQANGTYLVLAITPNAKTPSAPPAVAQRFVVPTPNNLVPGIVAEDGGTFYISFSGGASGVAQSGVWIFSGDLTKGPAKTISIPHPASSLAATNHTLYLLLSDGSLGQLSAASTYVPLPVSVPLPVHPADPAAYSATTPVPTPQPSALASIGGTAGSMAASLAPTATPTAVPTATPAGTPATSPTPGASTTPAASPTSAPQPTATPIESVSTAPTASGQPSGTLFPAGGVLAVDPTLPAHLLLGDGTNSRVVRLVASAAGPGLGLAGQYVYGAPLTNASRLAVTSDGNILHTYLWSGTQLAVFSVGA